MRSINTRPIKIRSIRAVPPRPFTDGFAGARTQALVATALYLALSLPLLAQEPNVETDAERGQPPEGSEQGLSGEVAPGGAMVFVSPETGELVSVPAAGQMERLLALGRALATQRPSLVTEGDGNVEPAPRVFQTPVGVGARLDDRFLHALRLRFDSDGRARWTCEDADHDHSAKPTLKASPAPTTKANATEAPES